MDSFGGGSTSNQLGSGSSEGVPYSVNVVENCLHKTRTLVFEVSVCLPACLSVCLSVCLPVSAIEHDRWFLISQQCRIYSLQDTSVEENDKIVQNDEISFQCSGDSIWSSFDKMDVHFDVCQYVLICHV